MESKKSFAIEFIHQIRLMDPAKLNALIAREAGEELAQFFVSYSSNLISKDPARYGFTDLQMQEPFAFDEMEVPGGTALSDVAARLGVDPEVIYDLNPHLIKKQTPPKRKWNVRVPKPAAEAPQLG